MERGRTSIVLRINQNDYERLVKLATRQGVTPNTLATMLLTPQIRRLENQINNEEEWEAYYSG